MKKLSKADLGGILGQVKANIAKLESCECPHDFKPQSGKPEPTFGERYKCTKCGGTVDHIAFRWYVKGLNHGVLFAQNRSGNKDQTES